MSDPISERIRAHLLHDNKPFTVSLIATWDVTDPYAVRLVLHAGTGKERTWFTTRDMLRASARKTVGDVLVQIRPVTWAGCDWRRLRLTTVLRHGRLRDDIYQLDERDVEAFLRRTAEALPFGAEGAVMQAAIEAGAPVVLSAWPEAYRGAS